MKASMISDAPGPSSVKATQFRAFDRVAGVSEISNAEQPSAFPLQQDKVRWPLRNVAWIAHEHCWPALHQAQSKLPVIDWPANSDINVPKEPGF